MKVKRGYLLLSRSCFRNGITIDEAFATMSPGGHTTEWYVQKTGEGSQFKSGQRVYPDQAQFKYIGVGSELVIIREEGILGFDEHIQQFDGYGAKTPQVTDDEPSDN